MKEFKDASKGDDTAGQGRQGLSPAMAAENTDRARGLREVQDLLSGSHLWAPSWTRPSSSPRNRPT